MTGVVLLHAFPYPTMWGPQLEVLQPRYPVIAPNYMGKTLPEAAEQVLREMDWLRWDKAVLVGLSMGGYLSFELWRQAPERIAGLVLADTRAGADNPQGRATRDQQAARIRAEGLAWFPEALLPNHLGKTTREHEAEIVQSAAQMILDNEPELVARSLEALRDRPDSTPTLPTIAVPTLILVGEEDSVTPIAEARTLYKAIEGSQMLILAEAGHLSSLESPTTFNTALLGFLAQVLS
ncbi:alpha/beta fold hydrolase [Calidithermus roseus]|uniref:3-oxoadipate enol-lactonase 2 n=1 Tax=Calidithermus roseus TaxID=1644118 RepID=A0A399EZS5_9DEIN|nr:alpha/beta fold hydrolase [Calidithermus roseus]RIH89263.1 3-oxoadipate enol-lactonase 2 [Calidithermus roseus]